MTSVTEQDKCFLVYGIHRSGTSVTAGILHYLGVHMGDQLLGKHIAVSRRSLGPSASRGTTRRHNSQHSFPVRPSEDISGVGAETVMGVERPAVRHHVYRLEATIPTVRDNYARVCKEVSAGFRVVADLSEPLRRAVCCATG